VRRALVRKSAVEQLAISGQLSAFSQNKSEIGYKLLLAFAG
jgi:hypothetical protein